MTTTIEVYYDPDGQRDGQRGCWRARLKDRHGIHDAGATQDEAVSQLLLTAKTFGYSGERADYEVEVLR